MAISTGPWVRHHDIRTRRMEHVGDWVLRTEEYRSWSDGIRGEGSDNSASFCYGGGQDLHHIRNYILHEAKFLPRNCDDSSLVIGVLCDGLRGRNTAVVCFYFDLAAQKEQSPTTIPSSLLKQVVGGLENIPAQILEAFRDHKKATGGRRLGPGHVIEMLQDIASSRPIFICTDALDECMPEYRAKLLDLLKQILHKSLSTGIFLAGRLHVRD